VGDRVAEIAITKCPDHGDADSQILGLARGSDVLLLAFVGFEVDILTHLHFQVQVLVVFAQELYFQ
jgi:hypothetical protein